MNKKRGKKKEPDMNNPLRLWTRKEVAEALEISERTLTRMIKADEILTGALGRIPNSEVLRLAGIDRPSPA